MFWRYNLITGSCIETLLDKENVTLKELMDEEDILQECKAQTKKLLDYLVRPDILDNTVDLMITEPELEDDEKQRYRYANRACELLTFDNPQIYDALAKEEAILKKLYNFLDTDETLNPLLASFFSKTMGLLITKKTEIMYNFLKDTDFLSLVLKHLDTSAIMDLLLRFITIENDEMRAIIIKWLNEQKLIQQLIKRIDLEYNEDVTCNASHTLCDIIKISREHMSLLQEKADPNPLLEAIESVEVISELLNHLFKDVSKEHAIVNGIPILLSLLLFKKQGLGGVQQVPANNTEPPLQADNAPTCFSSLCKNETEQMTELDAERLACSVLNALTAIIPRLEDFHNLLLNPPLKPAIKLTIGSLDPPFGNCRLEVAHLITALLHTNNHLVNVKLAELETFMVLMDLFFKYPWNNFLHTQVAQAVGRIFSNAPTVDKEGNKVHPLLHQMLLKYKITVKVLECFEEKLSKTELLFVSKFRSLDFHQKGYMGHLTKIANHIAQNSENSVNSNLIKEKMKELPEEHCKKWKEFVTDKLAEINKKNTLLVVSPVHSVQSASADECVDFRELPFTKDSSEPLAFSDFQMHEMTSHFIDQFGFNDDDEDEYDLSKQNLIYGKGTVNPLSQTFQMTWDGAEMKSSELFDEVCRSKINPDDTLWIERDRFDYETRYHLRANRSVEENNSSDSDEESQVFEAESSPIVLTSEEVNMDVDNQEAIFDGVPMDVAPVTIPNPWGESTGTTSTPDDQGNWADFSSFAAISIPTTDQSEVMNSSISVAMETSDSASVKFCSSDMSSVKVEDSVSNEMNRLEVTLKEKHKDSLGGFEETSKNEPV